MLLQGDWRFLLLKFGKNDLQKFDKSFVDNSSNFVT